MKKYALIGFTLLILCTIVSADLIPPNSHYLDKCVKINNIDSFTNYVIVGKITGPMVNSNGDFEIVELEQDTCLSKGYKFNQFKVYAIEKNYFDSVAKQNIDFDSSNVFESNIEIEPYGGYIDNSNPMTKLDVTLTIKEIKDGKLILEDLSGNSSPEPTPPTPPKQNQNILEIILCFFRGIFGMRC